MPAGAAREIGDRLAKAVLSGDITDCDTVLVDTAADVDELTIEGLEAGRGPDQEAAPTNDGSRSPVLYCS